MNEITINSKVKIIATGVLGTVTALDMQEQEHEYTVLYTDETGAEVSDDFKLADLELVVEDDAGDAE